MAHTPDPQRPNKNPVEPVDLKEIQAKIHDWIGVTQEALSDKSDKQSIDEKKSRKRFQKKEELLDREHEAKVKGLEQLQKDRKRYTGRLYWTLVVWLFVLIFIIIASGMNEPVGIVNVNPVFAWIEAFELSTEILIALIVTMNASVIGLFHFVAKYLFMGKHSGHEG